MIDLCARSERIAIRMESGMSEHTATQLTDAEQASTALIDRVQAMALHQTHKPQPLNLHKKTDTASLAAGGNDHVD